MKFMTHLVAGYPDLPTTRELILAMQSAGAGVVEIQIPFSDPLGDGPVIREACATAIKNGLKIQAVFDLLREMKEKKELTVPLYIMAYFNSVYHFGIEKFCEAAREAGVRGLIVPDYSYEAEAQEHLYEIAERYGLNCIRFIALDSAEGTIVRVAKDAKDFVYCFSMRGITGDKNQSYSELLSQLQGLRQKISQPLAVGFGISTPEHIILFKGYADMVIVGSALIRTYQEGGVEGVRTKVLELKNAL